MDLEAQNHLGMRSHVVVLNIDSFVIPDLFENQLIGTDLKHCCDTLAYVKRLKVLLGRNLILFYLYIFNFKDKVQRENLYRMF